MSYVIDQSVIAALSPEAVPPLYLCDDCAQKARRDYTGDFLKDVLLPMEEVSMKCENKVSRLNLHYIFIYVR